MPTLTVVAVVVDTKQVILYHADGTSTNIPQGDTRVRSIIDQAKPLNSGAKSVEIEIGYADVEHIPEAHETYNEFEKKSGGITRFFRVAKNFVKHIFDGKEEPEPKQEPAIVQPQTIGEIPQVEAPAPKDEALDLAIDQIIAQAKPVSKEPMAEDETVIAVVGNKIIPDVEKLEHQFRNANKLGSPEGVQRFLDRIASVIDKRGHSVRDLLTFMEKGDLPIANDGTILAYKVLKSAGEKGVYVDCHTGKVHQSIGSFVCMDPEKVDPNRYNECSHGLHIARRGYIRSFPGDVIVLCKIAPEDVIAVPHNDANKVRVAGYLIISELHPDDHYNLRQNKPLKLPESHKQIAAGISGDHTGIVQRVQINGDRGTNIVVTKTGAKAKKQDLHNVEPVSPIRNIDGDEPERTGAPVISPKQLDQELKAPAPTKADQARKLYTEGKMSDLIAFKKASKKSYSSLGFTSEEETLITGSNGSPVSQTPVKPETVSRVAEKPAKIPAKSIPSKMEEDFAAKKETQIPLETVSDKARALFNGKDWAALYALKKAKKKSWQALGFSDKEIEQISKNKL